MAYDVEKALIPYWEGSEVWNESFMDIKEGGERTVPLLYRADRILSVRSATLQTSYEEGRDYRLADGRLILPEGSRVAGFTPEELYPTERVLGKNFGRVGGGYILFGEGTVIHEHQTVVTYTHTDTWTGPVPAAKLSRLPGLSRRIAEKKPIEVLIYGDSISCGWNSSAATGIEPYAPTWMQMTMDGLQKAWPDSPLTWNNASEGGRDAAWALDKAPERLQGTRPDLAIIAFGMNDGTGEVSGTDFAASICGIMDHIRTLNPGCEFILIITMVPNTETVADFARAEALTRGMTLEAVMQEHGWTVGEHPFYGKQDEYPPVLYAMEEPGVICADMYAMHKALLEKKRYGDMTGNNVNHPNDFLARLYAQVLLATLK